jgi:hypothetical protein
MASALALRVTNRTEEVSMRSRATLVLVPVFLALAACAAFASGGKEGAAAAEPVAVKILMPGGPQPPDAELVFAEAKK